MSVDKFGLMGDDPEATIIQPIYKHASNLDDLENVEGFNEAGHEDQIYGFQLTGKGIYKRKKIDLSKEGLSLDNNGVVDRPMVLLWKGEGWITMPMYHKFDIDIKLSNQTVSTKGENHVVHKIFNSGSIICSLVPKKPFKDTVVLKRSTSGLSISTSAKRSVLTFKTEFDADEKLLDNNKLECVLIEGNTNSDSSDFLNLLNGLKVKWKKGTDEFKVAIVKDKNQYKVSTLPPGLETEFDQTEYNLSDIFLSQDYAIRRIRFSSAPFVSLDELTYL